MKRLIASIALLLVITTYLLSCEKDDICADGTPTTPGLVVDFYSKTEPDQKIEVANFRYYVPGREDDMLPPDTDTLNRVSRIILPLRTDQDEVTWALRYNSVSPLGTKTSNTDLFTIKYTRTNTYVSRACGYKTTFTLLPETNDNPNPLIEPGTDGRLIEDYTVVTPYIENQDEAHVKIYF